jgi:hypothetical protein
MEKNNDYLKELDKKLDNSNGLQILNLFFQVLIFSILAFAMYKLGIFK